MLCLPWKQTSFKALNYQLILYTSQYTKILLSQIHSPWLESTTSSMNLATGKWLVAISRNVGEKSKTNAVLHYFNGSQLSKVVNGGQNYPLLVTVQKSNPNYCTTCGLDNLLQTKKLWNVLFLQFLWGLVNNLESSQTWVPVWISWKGVWFFIRFSFFLLYSVQYSNALQKL